MWAVGGGSSSFFRTSSTQEPPMVTKRSPSWVRYGLASASVAVAALIAGAVPALRPTASALFAAATLLAATFGGFGPSLLAAATSLLCLGSLLLSPVGSVPYAPELIRIGPSVLLIGLAAWLGLKMREAQGDGSPGREWFEAFMANSPTFAYMKDDEGRYLYVNRRVQEPIGRGVARENGPGDLSSRGSRSIPGTRPAGACRRSGDGILGACRAASG